jgi:proteasome beta subunit
LAVVDAAGLRFLDDDTLATVVEQIVADRRGNPGGAR